MTEEIKVSVIMVTYNQEKYINEAIRSVVLQKFDYPYEIIIGDDCSTDRTLEYSQKWQAKYPNLIRIIQRDKNIGIQRNYIDTYNQCRGEYIAICEGDDFWSSKHKLRRQVEYMDTHKNCNICFHRVINYYMANNSKSLSNGKGTKINSDINDLAKSNYITNLSVMYRRNVINKLPEWLTEIASPDYVIHMLHASTGNIHYINKPMAVYRQHAKGIWGSNIKEKQLLISINSRKYLIAHFSQDKTISRNLINTYTTIALTLLLHYKKIGEDNKAKDLINEIFKYNPHWNIYALEQELQKREEELIKNQKKSIYNLLKKGRALISKFIPVPRIKN
ncbi:MAG: glycosyltransferase [Muribaculaceae bacterium]|nr:glycosyltransferase [Muribaculaceae bacterium]